ncbi:hypothetical protein HanIR_Chr04g0206051 [Helianthus annuus]|nr:hypothetical protein HanIR_Chr04g0206051 [Helianthus annuus]
MLTLLRKMLLQIVSDSVPIIHCFLLESGHSPALISRTLLPAQRKKKTIKIRIRTFKAFFSETTNYVYKEKNT